MVKFLEGIGQREHMLCQLFLSTGHHLEWGGTTTSRCSNLFLSLVLQIQNLMHVQQKNKDSNSPIKCRKSNLPHCFERSIDVIHLVIYANTKDIPGCYDPASFTIPGAFWDRAVATLFLVFGAVRANVQTISRGPPARLIFS